MLTSLLLFSLTPSQGRVVRVEIQSRDSILAGKPFSLAGPYEKISGRIHFAVNPNLRPNQIITDIGQAPLNSWGEVEFSSDFMLLKPLDVTRGNGGLFYEVSNRGGKAMLGYFNLGDFSYDPKAQKHFGDGFLMKQGFTLLWLGWQLDPPSKPGRIRLYPAIAQNSKNPITGLVRCDFVVNSRTDHHILSDRDHIPYPVSNIHDLENSLSVRNAVKEIRQVIPRTRWRFARAEGNQLVEDPAYVALEGGFEPGKIYEVIYRSQDPPLVGLGLTAVRDLVSHLKYEGSKELSIPRGSLDRALGWGSSQSGRFLRTFLYQGFNEDEKSRRVFDGVIPHVAGAGRGSFNHRFAQPSRDAQPFANFFYPTDIFPFTDSVENDVKTGKSDGLLAHFPRLELLPKIFYTNTSYEYWGRAASLIHTNVEGTHDADLPDNVRLYFFAGCQHGFGRFPPTRTRGTQLNNPMDYRWLLRALLIALDQWVFQGETPPPSRYPRLDRNSLVSLSKLNFPQIGGLQLPTRIHLAYRVDYGPRFLSEGVITRQPPHVGSSFVVLVPTVNKDGNEVDGIRLPELSVPLATYTGWNLFNVNHGPIDQLSSFVGSYLPFPKTSQERVQRNDPRISIEERYRNREQYLGLVSQAALELMDEGYVLVQDVPQLLKNARRHWDSVMK